MAPSTPSPPTGSSLLTADWARALLARPGVTTVLDSASALVSARSDHLPSDHFVRERGREGGGKREKGGKEGEVFF